MIGAGAAAHRGFARSAVQLSERSRLDRQVRAHALETLERLNLGHIAGETPAQLPFGTQKRIELARALVSRPKLLMLDEPANGLTAAEVDELRDLLLRIWQDSDVTMLIVEHHMGLVMSICQDIIVLDAGRLLARGTPEQVRANPAVIRAYLGGRDKTAKS
jgi:branched-chain amino acid transport system ATP-binding protein